MGFFEAVLGDAAVRPDGDWGRGVVEFDHGEGEIVALVHLAVEVHELLDAVLAERGAVGDLLLVVVRGAVVYAWALGQL